MSIGQRDIKLLWGRAASRCSICQVELSQDKQAVSGSILIGEQAHIVGEKEIAARGKSILSSEERNSYPNLILLCPNHHTAIDKNEADWPIEKLHIVKAQHELWVQSTLSRKQDSKQIIDEVIYSDMIDKAVELCHLENWDSWTYGPLLPTPRWDVDIAEGVKAFRRAVLRAVWPESAPALERALITFGVAIYHALQKFLEHAETKEDTIWGIPFYKTSFFSQEEYHKRLRQFEVWVDECQGSIFEATKAANWLADEVRSSVNPMFFATEGRFIVEYPEGFGHRAILLEYQEAEKESLPESLIVRLSGSKEEA